MPENKCPNEYSEFTFPYELCNLNFPESQLHNGNFINKKPKTFNNLKTLKCILINKKSLFALFKSKEWAKDMLLIAIYSW